jgi:hypothetical protein
VLFYARWASEEDHRGYITGGHPRELSATVAEVVPGIERLDPVVSRPAATLPGDDGSVDGPEFGGRRGIFDGMPGIEGLAMNRYQLYRKLSRPAG